MDRHGLWIDRGNHLFAGLYLNQLCTGLPDLMVEVVAMTFLNDDFVPGESAHVREWREDGVQDLPSSCRRSQPPSLRLHRLSPGRCSRQGAYTFFAINFPAATSSSSIRTKCSFPLLISSMTCGAITDPPITVTVPLMLMSGVIPSSS